MSNSPTKEIGAAIDVIRTLAEAIRTAKQIPSGHLYAMVMEHLSLPVYECAIELLKRAGLVSESGHLLTWTGPTLDGGAS